MTTPGPISTMSGDAAAAASPVLGADPGRGPSSAPTPADEAPAGADGAATAEMALPTVATYRDGDGRVHYASPHVKGTRDKLAAGDWTEVDVDEPPFDPTERKVREVLAHMKANAHDPAEVERVKAAEAAGEDRPTIASWSPPAPGDGE